MTSVNNKIKKIKFFLKNQKASNRFRENIYNMLFIIDKELISRIYKDNCQISKKEANYPNAAIGKGYICFTEEESQMINTPIKWCSIFLRVNEEMHINLTQYHFSVITLVKVLKIDNIKQWQGFRGVWIQSLWKSIWEYLI